ncbi:uncharacterized protein LOC116444731 [Corvus moneduloides]|uniref:uncharacterized protein LOC116444731 n=1 Tax=Corvus moneduloides TaxID=1196302 RepID=UPI0013646902|nr:uncharacterized protein LOC116444731 [Corvus moneduloides]
MAHYKLSSVNFIYCSFNRDYQNPVESFGLYIDSITNSRVPLWSSAKPALSPGFVRPRTDFPSFSLPRAGSSSRYSPCGTSEWCGRPGISGSRCRRGGSGGAPRCAVPRRCAVLCRVVPCPGAAVLCCAVLCPGAALRRAVPCPGAAVTGAALPRLPPQPCPRRLRGRPGPAERRGDFQAPAASPLPLLVLLSIWPSLRPGGGTELLVLLPRLFSACFHFYFVSPGNGGNLEELYKGRENGPARSKVTRIVEQRS